MSYSSNYSEVVPAKEGEKLSIGETLEVMSSNGNKIASYKVTKLTHSDVGIKVKAEKIEKEGDEE